MVHLSVRGGMFRRAQAHTQGKILMFATFESLVSWNLFQAFVA